MTASPDPESGKAADPGAIVDRILDELEDLGFGRGVFENADGLDWDDPDDRELVRDLYPDIDDSELIWPGFGPNGEAENARDDCGRPHPFLCDCCGHTVRFGRTCQMSVCTRCARAWARNDGVQKAAKIRRIHREKHYARDDWHQKMHHLVLSPPLDWFFLLGRAGLDLEEARELSRTVAKYMLEELRAQGALYYHPFRIEDDDGEIAADHSSMGRYKDLLFNNKTWSYVRERIAWKPHYHAIVVSDWIDVRGDGDEPGLAERVQEATGWVIHRIEDDGGKSLPNDGAMAAAVTYCGSHVGIDVQDQGSNRSQSFWVGAFEGDPIGSSERFSPNDLDLDWSKAIITRKASELLGISATSTDCNTTLPGVDDQNLLAKKILDEIYQPDQAPNYSSAALESVIRHVHEGDLDVDVELEDGQAVEISVTDSFGMPLAGITDLPGQAGTTDLPRERDGTELPRDRSPLELPSRESWDAPPDVRSLLLDDVDEETEDNFRDDDREELDDDPADQDGGADRCEGTLIPLEDARQRGLLDDPEWLRQAPHAREAQAADRWWPVDLPPWRAELEGEPTVGIG